MLSPKTAPIPLCWENHLGFTPLFSWVLSQGSAVLSKEDLRILFPVPSGSWAVGAGGASSPLGPGALPWLSLQMGAGLGLPRAEPLGQGSL